MIFISGGNKGSYYKCGDAGSTTSGCKKVATVDYCYCDGNLCNKHNDANSIHVNVMVSLLWVITCLIFVYWWWHEAIKIKNYIT